MFDLFRTRAEAVSAEVHRFPTEAQALDFIAGALRKEGVADAASSWAVWCDGPLRRTAEREGFPARMPGLHLEVTRERAAGSKVGISEFDWAIADTGTLAQDATDPAQRLVSTLTEIHVAVVRTGSLLPDLAALLERVDPARMRYVACVTGPSRTADIERVLTIGVHGPRRLVVVAIDEQGRERP
jgi:L-lactate dehydrogenase complex protein LldG